MPHFPQPDPQRPPSTEVLAERARRDVARGFADLYERVAPALFAWASLHVRQPLRARLDPEDVLQEVACRAFERFDSFDAARADFRGWMFGIARNVLYHALQRLSTSTAPGSQLTTGPLHAIPDSTTAVSSRVSRDESLAAFVLHVQALSDEDRRMLMYRGLEGLPHDEVGRLMGLSPDVAAKRWQRLRDRLREEVSAIDFVAA